MTGATDAVGTGTGTETDTTGACDEFIKLDAACDPSAMCVLDEDCAKGEFCTEDNTCTPIPALMPCGAAPSWQVAQDIDLGSFAPANPIPFVRAADDGRTVLLVRDVLAGLEVRSAADLSLVRTVDRPGIGADWVASVGMFDVDGDGLRDLVWAGRWDETAGDLEEKGYEVVVAPGTADAPPDFDPWTLRHRFDERPFEVFGIDAATPSGRAIVLLADDGWRLLSVGMGQGGPELVEADRGAMDSSWRYAAQVPPGVSGAPCSGCALFAYTARTDTDAHLFAPTDPAYPGFELEPPGRATARWILSAPSLAPNLVATVWPVSHDGGEPDLHVGVVVGPGGAQGRHIAEFDRGHSIWPEDRGALLYDAGGSPLGVVAGDRGASVVAVHPDGTPWCVAALFDDLKTRSKVAVDASGDGARDDIVALVSDPNEVGKGRLMLFSPSP